MSTKPDPRNLGAGMSEQQRIQDERLGKWQANTPPVKLPPSLQAAKDAAKPTCGDCRWCTERDDEDGNGKCAPPMPWWNSGVIAFVKLNSDAADECACFKKLGGKSK